jgi:hypothetical protein
MKIVRPLFIWWLSVLLVATGVFWAWHAGWIERVWHEDVTYLTSMISGIFFVSLLAQGLAAIRFAPDINVDYVDVEMHSSGRRLMNMAWFLSEIMMALGMLGTVIGLVYMLGKVFGSGHVTVDQLGDSIGQLWAGLGIALYTNAVGLITSITTKLNAFFIGWGND